MWRSLQVTASALVISAAVGVPAGTWLALTRFRGQRVLNALIYTGMGLPPTVVGLWVSILLWRYGPLGFFGLMYSPSAMVIAQAVIAAPLVAQDVTLGVLLVAGPQVDATGVPGVAAFANQAATAIENAELYDNLRQSYFETVRSLTRTLEARDPATAGHSERVTHLVALIGERLGLRRDEVDLLRFGAVLHDIGKVGISEEALGTVGPTNGTPADLLFQTHPLIGESILQPVSFLEPVLPMVTCHHEYLDGSGYPEGLRGESIPFFGRLAAAANEFDRLVSAWEGDPLEAIGAAREQIRAMAGTKLDAEIVDVLLQVTESMQELTGERGDLDVSADRDTDVEDEDEV